MKLFKRGGAKKPIIAMFVIAMALAFVAMGCQSNNSPVQTVIDKMVKANNTNDAKGMIEVMCPEVVKPYYEAIEEGAYDQILEGTFTQDSEPAKVSVKINSTKHLSSEEIDDLNDGYCLKMIVEKGALDKSLLISDAYEVNVTTNVYGSDRDLKFIVIKIKDTWFEGTTFLQAISATAGYVQ